MSDAALLPPFTRLRTLRRHREACARRGIRGLADDAFLAGMLRRVMRRLEREGTPSVPGRVSPLVENDLKLDDLALALACNGGMDDAWTAFVRDIQSVLAAVALRRRDAATIEAADDLAGHLSEPSDDGERRIGAYEGFVRLLSWAAVVLKRRSLDLRRSRRAEEARMRSRARSEDDGATAPPGDDVEPLVRAARAAFLAMTATERAAVRWRFVDDLPQVAIARLLGVSGARVSAILKGACGRLRAALDRALGAHSPERRGQPDEVWAALRVAVARRLDEESAGSGEERP